MAASRTISPLPGGAEGVALPELGDVVAIGIQETMLSPLQAFYCLQLTSLYPAWATLQG
jgi:hypothetical protein